LHFLDNNDIIGYMYQAKERRPILRNLGKNLLGIPEMAAGMVGFGGFLGLAGYSAVELNNLAESFSRNLGSWSTTPMALLYFAVEIPIFVASSLGALISLAGPVQDGLSRTFKLVPELLSDGVNNLTIRRRVSEKK